jgi:general stress protein YciG
MSTSTRGFASMRDKDRQRDICRKGGVVAHQKGTAHEWTHEEAKAAGRKGGTACWQKRRARTQAAG